MLAKQPAILTIVLLVTMALGPAAGAADERQARSVCQRLERDMDRLRSRMRLGYSSRQGERHRARMRRLKSRYYKRCRPPDR